MISAGTAIGQNACCCAMLTLTLEHLFQCIVGIFWVYYYLGIYVCSSWYYCIRLSCHSSRGIVADFVKCTKRREKQAFIVDCDRVWALLSWSVDIDLYTAWGSFSTFTDWSVIFCNSRARALGHGQLASFNDSVFELADVTLSCMNSPQVVNRCHLSSHQRSINLDHCAFGYRLRCNYITPIGRHVKLRKHQRLSNFGLQQSCIMFCWLRYSLI